MIYDIKLYSMKDNKYQIVTETSFNSDLNSIWHITQCYCRTTDDMIPELTAVLQNLYQKDAEGFDNKKLIDEYDRLLDMFIEYSHCVIVVKAIPTIKENEELKVKKRKCIAHINHCESCHGGISNYKETTPEDYSKGEPQEDDYEVCKKCHQTPKKGEIWQHTKTSRQYIIQDIGKLQCKNEKLVCAIYSAKDEESIWIRPLQDFIDIQENNLPRFFKIFPIESTSKCIWKPKKSDLFKLQQNQKKDREADCQIHSWHCEVCGIGLHNGFGTEIKTVYTWHESQNIAYPEIDHYKCNQCVEDSILPHNSCDWYRKQCYLDYLFHKRTSVKYDCKSR